MNPSSKATMACARWLQYCLSIGWPKRDLDRLQELWWEYHGDRGELLMGPGAVTRSGRVIGSETPH